jgi:hypothetical protein
MTAAPVPDVLVESLRAATAPSRRARKPTNPRTGRDRQTSTAEGRSALRDECQRLRTAVNGQRNDTLNMAAFRMGQLIGAGKLTRQVATDDLMATGIEIGLEPAEVAATIDSGIASGIASPRDEHPSESSWQPINLEGLLDGTHTPRAPTILRRDDGVALLYLGAMHSIYGEPESGKSWVFLMAAAEVLNDGGKVLCIDFESDAGSTVNRLLALGVSPEVIRDRFCYVQPDAKPDPKSGDFDDLVSAGFTLVGIDGMTACLSVFRSASREEDDIAAWINEFPKRFSRTGATVIWMDHVVKSGDGRGRFATGSHYKLGAIDGAAYVIEMTSPFGRNCRGEAQIRIAKDRHGALRQHGGEFKADRTQDFARLVIDATQPDCARGELKAPVAQNVIVVDRASDVMEKISSLVEERSGCSKGEIEKAIGGDNKIVRDALKALVDQGYVSQTIDGRRTMHVSVRQYRRVAPFRATESPR